MSNDAIAPDAAVFRRTMGLFATGVAIVATEVDAHVQAMTANAITSVSLDPMLLLFCPSKRARFSAALPPMQHFSINFLRDGQQALSTYFAGSWKQATPPPFHFVHDALAPRLQGALASLQCRRHALHEAGDHWLVVGKVLRIELGPEPHLPLLFYGGEYRRLDPQSHTPGPDLSSAAAQLPPMDYD